MTLSLLKNKTPEEPKPLFSMKQLLGNPTVKDEAAVTERAARYDFALGDAMTPGMQRLANDIRAGNEDYLREGAATRADLRLNQEYTRQVQDLARMGDTETLNTIINSPPRRSNPNTIIEEDFATRLLADTYFNDPDGPQTFEELSPQRQRLYTQTYEAYHDIVARDEIIQRKYEEYSAEWSRWGFPALAADFIETLIPFKDWLTFSTELETPGWSNINLPGDSKLAQVLYLHSLPLDEFEEAFSAAVDAIGRVNLNQTFEFIGAVQSYGRTQQALDNIFFLMDAGGVVGGATRIGAGAARRAGGAISNIRRDIAGEVTTMSDVNAVNQPLDFPESAANIARTGQSSTTPRELNLEERTRLQEFDEFVAGLDTADVDYEDARYLYIEARPGLQELIDARTERVASENNPNRTGQARELTPDEVTLLEDYDEFTEGLDTADMDVNYEDLRRQYIETNPGVQEALDARVARRMEDVRQANSRNESPSAMAAATGDLGRAVVTEIVTEPVDFKTPRGVNRAMTRRLFSYLNPAETVNGNGKAFSMARDLLSRSTTRINRLYDELSKTQMTIARLREDQYQAAAQQAIDVGRREFSRYGNVIRNVGRIHAEDVAENVDYVTFTLGKADGSIFSSPQTAGTYATKVIKLPEGSYSIEPVTGGYGIIVKRAVDETQDARFVNIPTEHQTRQPKLINAGPLAMADEIFGRSQMEARRKLVALVQRSGVLTQKLAAELKLPKGDRAKFTQFLENLRNANILPGVTRRQTTPNTIMDFEIAWRGYFNEAPSLKQKRAYFAWIRAHQITWGLKNLADIRGKQRKGIHRVSLFGRDKSKLTTDFDGQILDKSKFSFEDLDHRQGIVIYDSSKQVHEFKTVGDLSPAERRNILSHVQGSSQEIIRVWNRIEFPLKGIGENRVVDYVITGDYIRSPLKKDQIPFDPNGALIYDNPFQIKQLNTGYNGSRRLIFGERRVAPSDSLKEGHELARHFNRARDLYVMVKNKTGSLARFQNYVLRNLPQVNAQDLAKAFDDGTLSLTDEFTLMKQEDSILDANHTKNIRESIGGASDLSDDTSQGVSIEASNKPLFDLNIGEVISPVASIERNLQSAIKSGAVADYITKAAEQFVQEFGSVLKNSSRDLKEHPINALLAPQFVEKGLNADKVRLAKRFHRSVRDLLGYQVPSRRWITNLEDKIYESIYHAPFFGDKKLARWVSQFPSAILEDAPVLLRSLAFRLSMGFWNPYQIWKQVQTVTVTAGITGSPIRAMQGASGASLMMALNRSSKTPGMINNMAQIARRVGWDPDEFKELYDLADRSGFSIVRGEHSFRDRWLDPPVIQSGFQKVLHNSTMFFRGTEEFVRLNGIAVAYKEWRKANPNKAFRRLDQEAVIRRSDDLTVNMTAASNAMYNNSKILTFPTQFLSYQLRLMELFWGKRLTTAEKARLIVTQSALYGIPIGTTVATGILPLPEWIRKYLLTEQVDLDSNGAQFLTNGIYGLLGYLITGHENNAAQEFGPGGIDMFMEILSGDATFLETLFGASGTKIEQIFDSAYPLVAGLKKMLGITPGDATYDDFAPFFRNVATFTNIERAYYAMTTQAYLRKNGDIAMGYDPDGDGHLNNDPTGTDRFMEPAEIFWLTAFGVDPMVVTDEFLINLAMRDHAEMQRRPRELLMGVFERQFELATNTTMSREDKQAANERLVLEAQAYVAAGLFTPDQITGIIQEVARGGGATYARAWAEFSTTTTRADPNTLEQRRENFIETQRPLPRLPAGVLEGILP